MSILGIMAVMVYRKSDTINNMAISLWLILIQNPFAITNVGLILSYSATLGILLIMPIWKTKAEKNEENKNRIKWFTKFENSMMVSFSSWIAIFPINMILFQTISLTFFASNILVSFFMGMIMIFGFLLSIPIGIPVLSEILSILLSILIWISEVFSSFTLSHILVCPPPIVVVILYFSSLLTWIYIQKQKNKTNKRRIQKQVLKWMEQKRKWLWKNKVKWIVVFMITIIGVGFFRKLPQDLTLHFIDVGQGDCTFITTPHHKTILIDGGGSTNNEEYDVGKSVLLPYLLNHRIKQIDMMVISHFDADHCNGCIAILEELTVKRLIIGAQKEESEEYRKIIKIANKKQIPIQVVEKGKRLEIQKDLWFDVLYPEKTLTLQGLNNNSLVLRLNYGNFKMLFTGDIEKEAEQKLLKLYKETDTLKVTAIKIAHHGSKTSTTNELIKTMTPQIAVIRSRT